MKTKKGFTLIETIVCIGVLAILATASFFGIRFVKNNIRINKLEQITDKALLAAEVYLETNKETYNQLYNEQNGVIIPLNVLVNKGLLSLENTDLKKTDIENEYIITALLGNGGSGEDCVDITTNASWNLSKENPIYICNNKSSGTNSIIIGGTNSNIETIKVQDEVTVSDGIYTFSGGDNYIKLANGTKTYRIILVDRDDSLVLGTTESSFGNVFQGKTQKYATMPTKIPIPTPSGTSISDHFSKTSDTYYKDSNCQTPLVNGNVTAFLGYTRGGEPTSEMITFTEEKTPINGEVSLSFKDMDALELNAALTSSTHYYDGDLYYWWRYRGTGAPQCVVLRGDRGRVSPKVYERGIISNGKKIKLKSCMKITGGTGTIINPYEISDMC